LGTSSLETTQTAAVHGRRCDTAIGLSIVVVGPDQIIYPAVAAALYAPTTVVMQFS